MRTNLPSQLKWLVGEHANIPAPVAWATAKPGEVPMLATASKSGSFSGGKPPVRAIDAILLSDSDSDSDGLIMSISRNIAKKNEPKKSLAPSPVIESAQPRSSADSTTTVEGSLRSSGLQVPATRSFADLLSSDDDEFDQLIDRAREAARPAPSLAAANGSGSLLQNPGEIVSIHSSDADMAFPEAISRSQSMGPFAVPAPAPVSAPVEAATIKKSFSALIDDDDFDFDDIHSLPMAPPPPLEAPKQADMDADSDWSDDGLQVGGTPAAFSSPGLRRPVQGPTYVQDVGTELSKLQSEKIGLLERKLTKLMEVLDLSGTKVDTKDLDGKIKHIEQQMTRLGNDIIDSSPESSPLRAKIDTFDVPGSPQQSRFFPPPPQSPLLPESRDSDIDIVEVATRKSYNDNTLSSPLVVPSTRLSGPQITSVAPAANTNGGFEIMEVTPSQGTSQAPTQAPTKKLPFTNELRSVLSLRFGLHKFRFHQLEAMNATLAGRDVVVLMPTGGGKSLCYQLPALLDTGKTKGVTVVVSPLISLMQDQVDHLTNRNISAQMLSSRQSLQERDQIYALMALGKLKMLYISPEMLINNTMLNNRLEDLSREGNFARIVIDEAHCVSAWGHDFRTDYKDLMQIKNKFRDVPIIALTATANKAVLGDISQCVRSNHLLLTQSFNRTNLYYEVRPKTKGFRNDIGALCTQNYAGLCGIIYCRSRDECESLSSFLTQQYRLSCDFYHAGMNADDRTRVQESWQNNKISVICATIAFGMGIDKPNVRYVIHTTLPRSMEGYYQETGRAGRDGEPSVCILFYTFQDASTLLRLIDQDKNVNFQQREHQKELLKKTMQYCGNRADCRRKQVLQYFDEEFDPRLCKKQCDNCRQPGQRHVTDVSAHAQVAIQLMQQLDRRKERITLIYLASLLHGKVDKKGRDRGFDSLAQVGALKTWDRTQLERLLNHMCSVSVLDQYAHAAGGFSHTYVKCGSMSTSVMSGKTKVSLEFKTEEPAERQGRSSAGSATGSARSATSGSRRSTASNKEWLEAHERKRKPGGGGSWRKKRRTN